MSPPHLPKSHSFADSFGAGGSPAVKGMKQPHRNLETTTVTLTPYETPHVEMKGTTQIPGKINEFIY